MDWAAYATQALQKAGLTTHELLKDDEKVRAAAQLALKTLPFPVRAAARVVGFESLIFAARDRLLQIGSQ